MAQPNNSSFVVTLVTLNLLSFALLCDSSSIVGIKSKANTGTTLEPIDPGNKYYISWSVDTEASSITFELVVETLGYIGFGFSPNGGMTGADVIIGGVFPNGDPYFDDRYAVGTSMPIVDDHQDWELISFSENGTHTSLVVFRLLNTCDDEHDLPITSDTMRLIWSYGATDTISYHLQNRGTVSINLLDPSMPEFDTDKFDLWTLSMNATMPTQQTTYWCSVHKSPDALASSRHVVGFNVRLPNAISIKHTHHLVVFRCIAPAGEDPDTFFGQYVGLEGGDCFAENPVIPLHDICRSPVYAWAVGGKSMSLPENIGLPMNTDGRNEYFLVEMHYDNPDIVDGVRVESLIDIYSTTEFRPIEAGIGVVMTEMNYSHIIPPQVTDFVTGAHCSSQCTQNFLPSTGTFIFNVLLHSHKAGRKARVRHFRNGVELPWLISDDNYDFDFQQNRNLPDVVNVLPGDHLIMECTYDTRDRSNVTIAGYGTYNEMCQTIFFHYPANTWSGCSSEVNHATFLNKFGIEEVRWDSLVGPPIITAPASLAGMNYLEFMNTRIDWTNQTLIDELKYETRYALQEQTLCGGLGGGIPVSYPDVPDYVPEDPCDVTNPPTTTPIPDMNCTLPGIYFVPYPGNCSLYMVCSNYELQDEIQTCLPGTLFDPQIGQCNLAELVDCRPLCPSSGIVNLPHSRNCSLYWTCVNGGEPSLQGCAAGLYFDEYYGQCNLAELVLCPNICPSSGIINLPHNANCSLYWTCVSGQASLQECPPRLFFDKIPAQCNLEENVNCDIV